jgi:putative restriction endonuclease
MLKLSAHLSTERGKVSLRETYARALSSQNVQGSNKANSYLRALDLLGPILAARSLPFAHCADLYAIDSPTLIGQLYDYILEQQALGDKGIFSSAFKPSYWRSGFYSAALRSYRQVLVAKRHEESLWAICSEPGVDPRELGQRLCRKPFDAKALVDDDRIDFTLREGKEVLRQVKTRVNQDFFRKMILRNYGTRCCLTGLPVPEVLRASHIVGWADDTDNRMNPANGLCLSATYDAAFDRHLITFDEDLRLVLSPSLKAHATDAAFKRHFLAYEGHPLRLPAQHSPDAELLSRHRALTP